MKLKAKKYRPDKTIGMGNRTMIAMDWEWNKELTIKGHEAILGKTEVFCIMTIKEDAWL